jgi:hypothetical protein
VLTALLVTLLLASTAAAAKPRLHRFPHWWYRQAVCIHRHEASWTNHGVTWDGKPSPYFGGFQFLLGTWHHAGGRGFPDKASPNEQYFRAWIVWRQSRHSWSQWGTAGMCGLR